MNRAEKKGGAVLVMASGTPFYKKRGFRLFLLVLPFMALVFILSYFPLSGWLYAFYNYKPGRPLSAEFFVGFDNFTKIAVDRFALKDIIRVMTNTFGISILGIASSILPLAFAIFLNEIRSIPFRKTIQTLTTIPNFISWVLVFSIATAMFSVNDGFINIVLMRLGIISDGINFLTSKDNVWLSMTAWSVWKSLGWNAIVYIAALAGIDQQLYEAAVVDGAGRFRCMWSISVPGLIPTFIVLLIINISGFINTGMEQYYVFQNPLNKNAIEVLDLYLYSQGFTSVNYSFSIAVGILKTIVSLVLLTFANVITKAIKKESIF